MAVFFLPTGWGVALILAGLAFELGEAAFWVRVSRRLRPTTGAEALVDTEGYSVEEAILCCASGTVKNRCARGRARLLPLLIHLKAEEGS